MSLKEILVPDLGGADHVDVIELNVKLGDIVALDQGIVTLESDKATMEVPATFAGKIKEICVNVGDKLSEGQCVAIVEITTSEIVEKSIGSLQILDVTVPDLGGADSVDVIEINVKVGDVVAIDQGLITLESDKATMEVPATSAGTIKEIFVNIGDKLSEGQKVVAIETQEMINKETISSNVLSKNAPSQTNPLSITPTIQGTINPSQDVQQLTKIAEASAINPHYHATPMVRRLASEFGVDLSRVTATGPKGRILKDDIQLYVKQQLVRAQNGGNVGLTLPEMPVVDFSKFGDTETQALSKIKKLTGTYADKMLDALGLYAELDSFVSAAFREKGVSSHFQMLAPMLSGMNSQYSDGTGKVGVWQLDVVTAARYGLVVSATRDDRKDVFLSTRAAAAYLF
ncbi:MAG: E3 binding domain-containing protein [Gammaproteobacteria bacterium]|nr:E3 binding domain-containing protein [Gammaproteobacteria bacterium]